MRIALISILILCWLSELLHVAEAHPIGKFHGSKSAAHHHKLLKRQAEFLAGTKMYKAVSPSEKKGNIIAFTVGGFLTVVGAGLLGIQENRHRACQEVHRQQVKMQSLWDEVHPDGYTPVGDQMRPINFDCKVQERLWKPLISYADPTDLY